MGRILRSMSTVGLFFAASGACVWPSWITLVPSGARQNGGTDFFCDLHTVKVEHPHWVRICAVDFSSYSETVEL